MPYPQYEVRSYTLDWQVGILYEMAGLSEEAQALGRYHTEDVVLEVVRQVGGAWRLGRAAGGQLWELSRWESAGKELP